MMRDLKRYWSDVREIRAGLPEFVWLVEADGVPSPVEVGSETAAHLLHGKSHRLATDEEIRSQNARDIASRRLRAHEKLRREGVTIVPV